LVDVLVRTGKSHAPEQLKLMMSETDRAELTNHLKAYRFSSGECIEGARDWINWNDNQKLADLIRLVIPRSELQSDAQIIMSQASTWKIWCLKNPSHVEDGGIVAQ